MRISESRRSLRGGMQTDDVLALEQSAESSIRTVGVNGFPHRYQRGRIRPLGLIWKGDIFISTRVVPRKFTLSSLM